MVDAHGGRFAGRRRALDGHTSERCKDRLAEARVLQGKERTTDFVLLVVHIAFPVVISTKSLWLNARHVPADEMLSFQTLKEIW